MSVDQKPVLYKKCIRKKIVFGKKPSMLLISLYVCTQNITYGMLFFFKCFCSLSLRMPIIMETDLNEQNVQIELIKIASI